MRLVGFWFSALGVALTLAVLGLGAWTRLLDAGLGCPDWPGCYGFLGPVTEAADIALANQRYPNWPYEFDKAMPEMVHRYAATTLGLLAILGVLLSLAAASAVLGPGSGLGERLRRSWLSVLLLVVICLQGLLGYLTVSLRLWPHVVAAHLAGGLLVLCLFWLQMRGPSPRRALPVPRAWVLGVLALVAAQILLGGWVSSNYAALSCPDFPLCQGKLWPQADFAGAARSLAQPLGPNYLGGESSAETRTAIHLAHRLLALAVSAAVLVLAWRLWQTGLRGRGGALAALLLVQLCLGAANVLTGLAWQAGVLHNLGAAALLLALVDALWLSAPARQKAVGGTS